MVVLRDEGYSLQEIASKLKCNRSTVCITLAKQRVCGTVDDRKRSGRPRISTPRDDLALQRICLHHRRFTSSHLKREWEQSNGVTIDDVGLFGRVARKKPLLTDRHRQLRLQWAKEQKNWGMDQWYKVVQGGNSWGGWGGGGGGLWPPNFWPTTLFGGFSHTTDRKVPSEVVLMGSFMSVI